MRNSKATKELILTESANLFNTLGYKATSLSDITAATGLTKGAIYRHFTNKEDLERQALRSMSQKMFEHITQGIKDAPDFSSKMEVLLSFYESHMNNPLFIGGCPMLNAAVEADDSNPVLREQTYNMLSRLRIALERLFHNGKKNNQVRATINAHYYSTIFIATLEGGIMMSKLERSNTAINHTLSHLRTLIKNITVD